MFSDVSERLEQSNPEFLDLLQIKGADIFCREAFLSVMSDQGSLHFEADCEPHPSEYW